MKAVDTVTTRLVVARLQTAGRPVNQKVVPSGAAQMVDVWGAFCQMKMIARRVPYRGDGAMLYYAAWMAWRNKRLRQPVRLTPNVAIKVCAVVVANRTKPCA